MSDFESTASAAVAALHELQNSVAASGDEFHEQIPRLREIDNETRALKEAISVSLGVFCDRVRAAQEAHRTRAQSLRERLDQVREQAAEFGQKSREEFDALEELARAVDEEVEASRERASALTSEAVDSLVSVRDRLGEYEAAFNTTRDELEAVTRTATESLQTEAEELRTTKVDLVELHRQIVERAELTTDSLVSRSETFATEWNSQFDALKESFESWIDDGHQELCNLQNDQVERLGIVMNEMSPAFLEGTQLLQSVGETTLTAVEAMNIAVDASEAQFRETMETVDDTIAYLRRVVS